jgi:hypothetical protein
VSPAAALQIILNSNLLYICSPNLLPLYYRPGLEPAAGPKDKSSPVAGMMNDESILHYQCAYAASGRFSCKDFKCKAKIAKGKDKTLFSYQYNSDKK